MSSAAAAAEERRRREELLSRCFDACDKHKRGRIDREELRAVALAFNPQSSATDVEDEVKLIMRSLDKDKDSVISREEWVSVLNELFHFMDAHAFDTHCQELFSTLAQKPAAGK